MISIKRNSLRFRLILGLSLIAIITWLIASCVAWYQVRNEVNKVFDSQQVIFAERLATTDLLMLFSTRLRTGGFRMAALPKKAKPIVQDNAFSFAVFNLHGEKIISDGRNGENIIFSPKKGFDETKILDSNDNWRIYWKAVANGRLFIAVGQDIGYRNSLVSEMVLSQLWIWFASLPILLFILAWLISQELKRLKRLGKQIEQRKPDELAPIAMEDTPTEILPLVKSLNRFFERTSHSFLLERRFTSDAAHELRSPLAALRIHTELAQMAADDSEMREQALHNLTLGIDRASQLIEQLLILSRLDNLEQLNDLETLEWEKIICSLINELQNNAQKRQITLLFDHQGTPPNQQGQALLISLMLRNLIDNAIKYCTTGSCVKIILQPDRVVIADNGGGVLEEDLEKLGHRFYRPAGQNEKGSGLGLSIVHRIAKLHQYQMKIENSPMQDDSSEIGLKVSILFQRLTA